MKIIAGRIKDTPWYCWLLAFCLVCYLIYIILSLFYLPGKLESITETDASRMIGRKISAGDISFNPFTLSLTIQDLSVPDTPGEPLVGWDHLLVNFGFWKSVFTWEIAFDEIRLDNPQINIIKQKNGFNFSDIIEKLTAPDSEADSVHEKKEKGTSIAIEIFNTSINRGTFTYMDNSGSVTARANLNDISIMLEELYFATGDEHLNAFNITANNHSGGKIQFAGKYRIHPLHVEGNIKAEGIDISAMSKFLENIAPVRLSKGILSFNTNVIAKNDPEFTLKTDMGNLSINDLLIDDSIPVPSMLNAGNINVEDFNLDLTGRKISVENIILDNITINQWIDENGRPRYERLFNKESGNTDEKTEESVAKEENTGAPWDIMVKRIFLENSTINFEDLNEKINRGHSLSGINLELQDISLTPENKIVILLKAMLDETGNIKAEGSMYPSPFSMQLTYHLDKILLNLFSEYLETATWLTLEDGSLFADGKVSVSKDGNAGINASASLSIDDLKLNDTRSGDPLFSIKEFKLEGIAVETDKQNMSIASINISKPALNLSMSDKKGLNLAGLAKGKQDSDSSAAKEDKSQPWKLEIEKIGLNDGTLLFSDESVKPTYKTGLHNITFSLDRIGSEVKDTAPFSFKSDIDKYAPFTIAGSLDPIDEQPGFDFKSMVKGLEMTNLSPYSGIYIGNNLKSGKLTLNLDYSLHDRKLKGKNNINMKNLYLGEKLSVKPVIDAPVGLGLALLRDLSGVIDLNVGISGNLDDPGFSVSGIIIKALVNIIVKAAASPFKLLGALIPEGSEDLGNVTFEPGNSHLNKENKDNLQNLTDALNKRPQLILTIKGNASEQEDIEALKINLLKQKIAKKRRIALSKIEEELKTQDLWMIGENRPVLEAINDETGLSPVHDRMEKLDQITASENTENLQADEKQNKTLFEETIYKQVYDDIIAAEKIDEEELISLAEARALSIKQYLVDDLKLSHERISVIKATQSDLSGRVIKLGLDVM